MNTKMYQVYSIGYVRRSESGIYLEIGDPFRPALKQFDHFSHVIVFWWANRNDNEESRSIMQTEPPYAAGRLTGLFAWDSIKKEVLCGTA